MTRNINDLPPKRSLLEMRDRVVSARLDANNWRELEILTGCSYISSHPRLLRSLSWGDPDYDGCVLGTLNWIYTNSPMSIFEVIDYLDTKFPDSASGENISSQTTKTRKIVFNPMVFDVPDGGIDHTLVSVMMPFARDFDQVYKEISSVVAGMGLTCSRASDIWEQSTIIQDIFSLIFRSKVVVCDFSGKNPNVFYEAGIAHTLGKNVIPITQNGGDIPFDLAHHRYLSYLNNKEGLLALGRGIEARLWNLGIPF